MESSANHISELALDLLPRLSDAAKLLVDPSDESFKESMKRWSDVDIQIPSAIFKPALEEDIVEIVKQALAHKIPIVSKAGGQSLWSTTAGWIIDLSLLKAIKLDVEAKSVTVQPGVITKEFNVAVAKAGFYTPSAGASAVGYIPFLLGGGLSWLNGIYGLAVDNLLSTRIMTATKGLVNASETENSDLFWALKGAGQFFGIVTEVTTKVFPIEESMVSWVCIYPPSQVKDVGEVLERLANGQNAARSPGMAAIMVPPGQTKPMILVKTMHLRSEEEAKRIVEPLLALKPVHQVKQIVGFAEITDATDTMFTQGGLKAQISCGLQRFDGKKFEHSLQSFTELLEEHPGTSGSFFMMNWWSTDGMRRVSDKSSAYSHRDCRVWSMCFMDASEKNGAKASIQSAEAYIKICQEDQEEFEKAFFPNHNRVQNLDLRYRGKERLQKLRKLKAVWDPEGVFTSQLL